MTIDANNIEYLMGELQKARANYDRELEKFHAARKLLWEAKEDLDSCQNRVDEHLLAKLEPWHPPVVDDFWKRAVLRTGRESKALLKFIDNAYSQAKLDMYGHDESYNPRFAVLGWCEDATDTETMRKRLESFVEPFADLYVATSSASTIVGKEAVELELSSGSIGQISICVSKDKKKTSLIYNRRNVAQFKGPNCIAKAIENALEIRAMNLSIPYHPPASVEIDRRMPRFK